MEDSTIDASCSKTGESRKVKRGHQVRVHKGKRRHHHHHHFRKREARQRKHLIRRCAAYGPNPPDMDTHPFGLTGDDTVNDPLSPSGRDSEGIKRRPAEPFDSTSYLLNMLPRDDSGSVPKKSGLNGMKYFWTPPLAASTTEMDDEVDLDVLVLGPEIEDSFDLILMSFCGML